MGDILGVIVALFTIASIVEKTKKKKKESMPKEAFEKPQSVRPAEQMHMEKLKELVQSLDAPSPQPTAVAAPRIAPQIQPTPHEPDMFAGSMNAVTHEGEDPCHEEQLVPVGSPSAMLSAPEEKAGITLEWTGENMVRAFIMQEVLTRPCDRRRRA